MRLRAAATVRNTVVLLTALLLALAANVSLAAPQAHAYNKYWITTFTLTGGYPNPVCGTSNGHPCGPNGYLYAGSNYVFCRTWGAGVDDGEGNFNRWWLWTDLDTPAGSRGWVSAYYLSGQGNDQADYWNGSRWVPIPNC
ncbi:hypothetical protein [Streptomyces sp. NBC_01408]|uniref:hypothetical protein n=1 Tax=Streptomyces sp. NBC_01408 TaxID=2903855 RepID=UPI00224E0F04|nr:hypothetical protein [Streptomyces sp. NBC_01408]MCX4695537.1 hypothetical protein [Streptomyces sp. NBC_01408]